MELMVQPPDNQSDSTTEASAFVERSKRQLEEESNEILTDRFKSKLRHAIKSGKKVDGDTTTTTQEPEQNVTPSEVTTTPVEDQPDSSPPSVFVVVHHPQQEPNRPSSFVTNFVRLFQSLFNFVSRRNDEPVKVASDNI